jgi:uncharacterized protein YbjQ (UPF0145 family)
LSAATSHTRDTPRRGGVLLATSDTIAGHRVVRTLGLVRGNTIRSRHIGRDILANLRNVVGGEISEYTKLLAEAREQALDRLVEEAESLGANAVVSLRFQTTEVMKAAAELLAYGTAVVIEEDSGAP